MPRKQLVIGERVDVQPIRPVAAPGAQEWFRQLTSRVPTGVGQTWATTVQLRPAELAGSLELIGEHGEPLAVFATDQYPEYEQALMRAQVERRDLVGDAYLTDTPGGLSILVEGLRLVPTDANSPRAVGYVPLICALVLTVLGVCAAVYDFAGLRIVWIAAAAASGIAAAALTGVAALVSILREAGRGTAR